MTKLKLLLWALAASVTALIALFTAVGKAAKVATLEADVNRLSVELSHADIPLQRDTIHDSIEVVTQVVVEVVPKKLKEALEADKELIKDLNLKVKQLEAMQTTVTETKDTARADSLNDLVFSYSDRWSDLKFSLKDSTFYYNIRDSLSTLVYREYRHHFLIWRWGVKGYRLKIVNFNPHTKVTYNRYIKVGK